MLSAATVPTTTYGLIAIFVGIPIYRAFQEQRFNLAVESSTLSIVDQEFRVPASGYLLPIIGLAAGWVVEWHGILAWVHTERGSEITMVFGACFILLSTGTAKGLINSRISLTSSVLEYKYGSRVRRMNLEDIETVEFKRTQVDMYILVRGRNDQQLKIPTYFGPRFFVVLKTRVATAKRN